MSVQIDMTNYEAFYLDYLEGNLSGDALTAFETFMAEHPELALEDDTLLTLEAPADTAFDPLSKLALKKGIDLADLNDETLDFFLIARTEGLLDEQQEAHLNHWLEANAHYRQDADLYALVQLEADTAEVFAGKEALKKPQGGGRVIPMWFTGVAVAAGLALLITIGINSADSGKNPVVVAGTTEKPLPLTGGGDTLKTVPQENNGGNDTKAQKNGPGRNEKRPAQQQQRSGEQQPAPVKKPRPAYQRSYLQQETVLASLEKRNARLNTGSKTVEPMPVIARPVAVQEADPNNDMAWTPVTEMKNPIEPVTNKLSTTLNTPVDFRTAKASKHKGGGFFLKIGKLQVSHQSGGQSASIY